MAFSDDGTKVVAFDQEGRDHQVNVFPGGDAELVSELRKHNVQFAVVPPPEANPALQLLSGFGGLLINFLPLILLIGLNVLASRGGPGGGMGGMGGPGALANPAAGGPGAMMGGMDPSQVCVCSPTACVGQPPARPPLCVLAEASHRPPSSLAASCPIHPAPSMSAAALAATLASAPFSLCR